MGRLKKYYDTKKEATAAKKALNNPMIHVWKMPRGTRNAGKYAVCTEIEFMNTY